MTVNFLDLPNGGKLITVTSRAELKASDLNILALKSKDTQGSLILNLTTGEAYTYCVNSSGNLQLVPTDGVYKYTYDFSVHGGAVSTIELAGPKLVAPVDICDGYYDVTTEFTGGVGCTFSLGTASGSATNIKADNVLATNGTSGRKVIVPDFHVNGITNIIDVSTSAQPVIKITTTDVTAGVLELFLFAKQRQF